MSTAEELALRAKLARNFRMYSGACLKIRTKAGEIKPLVLNHAQLKVHQVAEELLRNHGKIRIILLKARQLGMSTYIEARFFWKVTHRNGVRGFILTHHADATSNLFAMCKMFHEQAPEQMIPMVGASSSRELQFPDLTSGYKVGTAGTEGIGRSDTFQYFHGSEVAFWPKAETHTAGALQAVAEENGTEVWLESTANGLGGKFHEMWVEAVRGENGYTPIFLPWFDDPQYKTPLPQFFEPTGDEVEYADLYELTIEQICWRRHKRAELGSDWLFRQEYPATAEEAFQVSGEETLIDSMSVIRARKCEVKEPVGALVIGVDPADGSTSGRDRTAIIRRQGRKCFNPEVFTDKSPMEVVGIVGTLIDLEKPKKVFIDKGGIGSPMVDRLLEMGYGKTVVGVNFGAKPMNAQRYYNLRSEMWGKTKTWLEDQPCDIPDDNSLHQDLCAPAFKYTSARQIKLEAKEDMAKRGLRSPDIGDALALTFAYPVRDDNLRSMRRERRYKEPKRAGTWMSV